MADIFKKLNHFASGKSVLAGIVAANAIVFLLIWTSMLVSRSLGYGNMANWLILPPSFEETILQPWSIATYMFTHIRLLHLVANMAWLYCFGIIFLDLYPNRALMRTYIAGGLAGAILYLAAGAVHPLNGLAGASGPICLADNRHPRHRQPCRPYRGHCGRMRHCAQCTLRHFSPERTRAQAGRRHRTSPR